MTCICCLGEGQEVTVHLTVPTRTVLCQRDRDRWLNYGIRTTPISTPPPPAGLRSPAGEGVAELNTTPESASV